MVLGIGGNGFQPPYQGINNNGFMPYQAPVAPMPDAFSSSARHSKKGLLAKTIGQIGVILGGAFALNKLHNSLGTNPRYQNILSKAQTVAKPFTSIFSAIKGNSYSAKLIKSVNNLPAPIKMLALGLSTLMVGRSLYRAGAKDASQSPNVNKPPYLV